MTGNLSDQLVDSSRMIADIVVANIGHDQELYDDAVRLMFEDKYPVSMRAARIVQVISKKYPEMARPHISSFIKNISVAKVDGVRRSIMKILSETPFYISEDLMGQLTEYCFNFIKDPDEPIAIRAFSIDMLVKISKKYPEINPEIIAVLESIYPEASVGLKNRCNKVIPKLMKNKAVMSKLK